MAPWIYYTIYSRDQNNQYDSNDQYGEAIYPVPCKLTLAHYIDKLAPQRDKRLVTVHSKRIQTVDKANSPTWR